MNRLIEEAFALQEVERTLAPAFSWPFDRSRNFPRRCQLASQAFLMGNNTLAFVELGVICQSLVNGRCSRHLAVLGNIARASARLEGDEIIRRTVGAIAVPAVPKRVFVSPRPLFGPSSFGSACRSSSFLGVRIAASHRAVLRDFSVPSSPSATLAPESALAAEISDALTIEKLEDRVLSALAAAFGDAVAGSSAMLTAASNPEFGDYQCNAAMPLAKKLGKAPRAIAEELIKHLVVDDMCQTPSIAGPGFINLSLKPDFIAQRLRDMQTDGRLGVPKARRLQRVAVDFSSPNVAKEMHVGHLRSTIIGDCLARILEFRGHDVLRLNHVGDWGTQFGMLITYLREAYPEALTTSDALDIGDLVALYKKAKIRFDQDEAFRDASRLEVVRLQSGAEDSRRAWDLLCNQSRREFNKIYATLGVRLEERGESFYNSFLRDVLSGLREAELLVEDDGCQVVYLEGYSNKDGKPQPLIVQKSDGGFNYATTDLAAVRHRIGVEHCDRLVYVTDQGQSTHFAQFFQVARRAGWLPDHVEAVHVPFGLVQGENGKKLATRSGDTIRLADLLREAVTRAETAIVERLEAEGRSEPPEFIKEVSEVVGIGAVKYADLSQNRTSNYVFSFDKMLALQGNTAPYMLYAYVRTQGIARKGEIDFAERFAQGGVEVSLVEDAEKTLSRHLLRFAEVLSEVERDLMPNRLCAYLYDLSAIFNQFYLKCPVLTAEDARTRESRLVLCYITAQTLELGLSLLGIQVVQRM